MPRPYAPVLVIALALATLCASPAATAADRLVVAELLSAQNCPPCAVAGPEVSNLYEANRGEVVVVTYHPTEFDGVPDPLAIGFEAERRDLYGFEGYPTVFFDGDASVVGGYEGVYSDYAAELEARLAIASPIAMEVTTTIQTGTVLATVDLMPERDVRGSTTLFVVLTEDRVRYDADNGVKVHRFIAREVQKRDIMLIEGREISADFELPREGYARDQLNVVAFVQDMGTGEIHQGAASRVEGGADADEGGDEGAGDGGMNAMQAALVGAIVAVSALGALLVVHDRRRAAALERARVRRRAERRHAASPTGRRQGAVSQAPDGHRTGGKGGSGRASRRKRSRRRR
ncbi:MAG: hypothetical protein L0Z54_03065 [Thermoplasmata archaeon]|nr:hypothetical protein [Thermoplasmata archaeon]